MKPDFSAAAAAREWHRSPATTPDAAASRMRSVRQLAQTGEGGR
jgi:hypothetical protein